MGSLIIVNLNNQNTIKPQPVMQNRSLNILFNLISQMLVLLADCQKIYKSREYKDFQPAHEQTPHLN